MRPRLALPLAAAVAATSALALTTAGPAAAANHSDARHSAHHASKRVVERPVSFVVRNRDDSLFGCSADNHAYTLHGTMVGPANAVLHSTPAFQVNVLLHDAGTGGWFWHLKGQPRFDYATQLARQGQTSLVLDRLGYDSSPLKNGNVTCVGAQVDMTHQVVQELYSGKYRMQRVSSEPVASHVVLQGHGTGATVAQLEAARYDDVRGIVIMSAPDTSPSQLATQTLQRQEQVCRGNRTFAAFGQTGADFKGLLFRSATPAVQRAAVTHRNQTPCGDVDTIATSVAQAQSMAAQVKTPVLQLDGARDARGSSSAYGSSGRLTRHVIAGAGSALPLERQAPMTRRLVVRWLHTLRGF